MAQEAKHTPGPWRLELRQSFPFGFEILAGQCGIIAQDAYCFSSKQKTREDNERGVGFPRRAKDGETTAKMAADFIAEQDANARLIAAAPDLLSIVLRFVALPGGAWNPERHAAEEAELMQDARTALAKAG